MTGAPAILIDGKASAVLSALDRGLAYGDGLFRTVRIERGQPLLWERHLAHLVDGCERLGIPAVDPMLLAREAASLFADGGDGVLKIVVTRGSGGRGYRPPEGAQPTRMVARFPLPPPPALADGGVRVRLCATRAAIQPATAGIKTLNRLDQVLARAEWSDAETFEGLMLDTEGFIVGGTMSNLFLAVGKRLLTPIIDRAGIAGAMRAAVLDAAQAHGIEAAAARLSPGALAQADEAFLTNAVIGVVPIADLCGRVLAVGALAGHMREVVAEAAAKGRRSPPWPIGRSALDTGA
jgi:4-amino-4-deoxychorismate lyase